VRHMPMVDLRYSSNVAMAVAGAAPKKKEGKRRRRAAAVVRFSLAATPRHATRPVSLTRYF
jgi:hypothetical protein